MKLLFLGGNGNISSACTNLALRRGYQLYHLSRGLSAAPADPADATHDTARVVHSLQADINDEAAVALLLKDRFFDAVVDFICFTPLQAASRLRLFTGKTRQYVFVSSASVYQKPASGGIIDEKSAIGNPYWLYAADKIASEAIFQAAARQTDFPLTIVRPSHTYGTGWLPSQYTSADFTIASRLLAGLPLAVPGDGQSLWTLTHVRDFAVGLLGLCGQAKAIGHTFNIAGDDVLTWDEIYRKLARALAVEARLVHIPSDFIARVDPALGQTLLGDKACSAVFDNSLLCSVVPDFATTIRLDQGLAEALAWRRAAPERTKIDGRMNARIETILERWAVAMQAAFPQG